MAPSAALDVAWAVSLADTVTLGDYSLTEGLIAMQGDYAQSVTRSTSPNPLHTLALASPERKHVLDPILDRKRDVVADPAQVAAAGNTFVITDSACEGEWSHQDARVQPERIEPYAGGTLTLWRVAPIS